MTSEPAGLKVLMFDFYGTVVDMQGGLTEAIAPYLKGKGYSGDPGSVVTWWRRTHFENSLIDALLHREHTPYREIGHRAVDYTLERAGIPHTEHEVRELVDAITRLRPFPDVVAALDQLRGTYELVILSNGDRDMLAAGVQHSQVAFDRVISVAEANAFKLHVAARHRRERLRPARGHAADAHCGALGAPFFASGPLTIDYPRRAVWIDSGTKAPGGLS